MIISYLDFMDQAFPMPSLVAMLVLCDACVRNAILVRFCEDARGVVLGLKEDKGRSACGKRISLTHTL